MADPNANSGVVGFIIISLIAPELAPELPFNANTLNVPDTVTVLGVAQYVLQITM